MEQLTELIKTLGAAVQQLQHQFVQQQEMYQKQENDVENKLKNNKTFCKKYS